MRNGGEGVVSLHDKKQFTKEARYLSMLYATHMLGWHRDLFKREKERIALAACTIISYDLGYKRVTGKYSLDKWLNRVEDSVRYSSSNTIVDNRHKGKTSYTDRLTSNYPQYLHQLWQYATDLLGDTATFGEITQAMNQQSTTYEHLPTINLNKFSLYRWFKKNKGKEKRVKEKPLLTEEHKIRRLQHSERMLILRDQGAIVCYLDEKWFYIFSCRKKSKHLPRADFEGEGADRLRIRRVISRSHPIKTMFMGVLTSPIPEQNFNGLLALKRLSRQEILRRGTYQYRFHIDHHVNWLIVEGGWRSLHDDDTYRFSELSQLITEHYELEEDISQALCFRYSHYEGEER